GVNVVFHVQREDDASRPRAAGSPGAMVRIRFCERNQTGAVEIDPVVMDEIRILPGIHPARLEPDLVLLSVDFFNPSHGPLAPGYLVLNFSAHTIVKVQVIPAVALRHPYDFLTVGQIVAVLLAGVAKEGLRLFADNRARSARCRVHFDYAVDLMSSLVILKRE